MAKAKSKKKKRKKIKFNYIVIFGIIAYLTFKMMNNISNATIPIDTVKYGELTEKMKKTGIIIRDEKIIQSKTAGKINYFVKEGQRIPIKQKVADIEIKKVNSNIKEKLDTVDRRIQGIKEHRSEEVLKQDMDKIDNNIKLLTLEIQHKLSDGETENIQNLKEDLLYLIDKRSLIWGEKSIAGKNIKTLEEEKNILENRLNRSVCSMFAEDTGIVSFNSDGLEEIFKVSSLDELDSEYLSKAKENKSNIVKKDIVKVGDTIAKVVNNHIWYIATILDKDEKNKFKINKSVKIIKDGDCLYANPIYIYKDKLGKYIGVFEINEEKGDFYSKRTSDITILYKQLNGIKIPKKAIITKNGKKGVFILSETGNAEFKELKSILGENKQYVVLNYKDIKRNKIDTVDLYDELILNPQKIKDGQKIR